MVLQLPSTCKIMRHSQTLHPSPKLIQYGQSEGDMQSYKIPIVENLKVLRHSDDISDTIPKTHSFQRRNNG